MKLQFLTAAMAALTLAACAAPMSSRPDPLALQNAVGDAPEEGLLVIDTSGNLGCNTTTLGLIGDTGGFVSLTDYRATESGPAIRSVKPGKYRIFTGRCTVPGYYPSQLPNIRGWFGTIDVAAGETVYAGTLDTNRVDVKSKLEGLGAAWSALTSLSTKEQSTYLTYEMLDKSGDLKAAMKAGKMGEGLESVADRLVYKPPLAILDKGEYEAAITRAYSKTPEGKTPTKAEVDARFADEMIIALKNSLTKVADEMGLTEEEIEEMTTLKSEDETDTEAETET